MTSIAERFIQEGKTEIVINMLEANLDINLISKYTKFPVQKIEELKRTTWTEADSRLSGLFPINCVNSFWVI